MVRQVPNQAGSATPDQVAPSQLPLSPTRSAADTRLKPLPRARASFPTFDLEKIAQGVRLILDGIGEDCAREGLEETPLRVARLYQELVYGRGIDPSEEITCEFFEKANELILVRDIQFSSICEHHLLPFVGIAHVGYIPKNGRITGLSKLARVVELAGRRLQVQERMTTQIADALVDRLSPVGVAVVIEAEHFCMTIRGVKKPGSKTVTSALRGIFQTDWSSRSEVMALINSRN